ncbi:MAG: GNAT family N-acetyltransferase [Sneathiella sp.]|nr:GNAT family N-acetyltransferase [Sneathiella sp.]
MTEITIRELTADEALNSLNDLTEILHATVNSGASVGFILPYSMNDSRTFWQNVVFLSLKDGKGIFLVAVIQDKVVGTVQLSLQMPPNQSHRGEITKLLVHPEFRNQGIARQLMRAVEKRARDLGKSLLTLDTRTGDTAEPLYTSLGFQTAGVIPGYCRAPETDRYDATTYMYKALHKSKINDTY